MKLEIRLHARDRHGRSVSYGTETIEVEADQAKRMAMSTGRTRSGAGIEDKDSIWAEVEIIWVES